MGKTDLEQLIKVIWVGAAIGVGGESGETNEEDEEAESGIDEVRVEMLEIAERVGVR